MAFQLTGNVLNVPITVAVDTRWSDWNGQVASSSAAVTARFDRAIQNVQSVGLSLGRGCFFENGVSVTSEGADFQSEFIES